MKNYQHILVALDFGSQSEYIMAQALHVAAAHEAQLKVLHIIEPVFMSGAHFADNNEKMEQAKQSAKKSFAVLFATLNITHADQILQIGEPQNTIIDFAVKHTCDLIVVGSHGVGGLLHTLGSTAHYLLENSPCDVLMIQVKHLAHDVASMPLSHTFTAAKPASKASQHSVGKQGPLFYGSKQGFGEEVQGGPKPRPRPVNSPYHGGTRKEDPAGDEEEGSDKK